MRSIPVFKSNRSINGKTNPAYNCWKIFQEDYIHFFIINFLYILYKSGRLFSSGNLFYISGPYILQHSIRLGFYSLLNTTRWPIFVNFSVILSPVVSCLLRNRTAPSFFLNDNNSIFPLWYWQIYTIILLLFNETI